MGTGTLALIAQIIGLVVQGPAVITALDSAYQALRNAIMGGTDPTPADLAAIQSEMDAIHAQIQNG